MRRETRSLPEAAPSPSHAAVSTPETTEATLPQRIPDVSSQRLNTDPETRAGSRRRKRRRGASSTAGAGARRVVGRPWKPGQSGNPAGVPAQILECRRLALLQAPKAIARLAGLLDSRDERVRVAAAEALLDRAGLRPFALEPDRHELLVAPVDVETLRAVLTARLARLQAAESALPAGAPEAAGASSAGDSESRPLAPEEGDPHEAP